MYNGLEISNELLDLTKQAESELQPIFAQYDELCLYNSAKVLKAFQNVKLTCTDFSEQTGYGYYDLGRDKLEQVYSEIFHTEDALVRPQIMSGTHALSLTFFGLLKYGDTLISITGEPYDSLKGIIGLSGDSRNSLIAHGIKFEQIDLVDSDFDIDKIVYDNGKIKGKPAPDIYLEAAKQLNLQPKDCIVVEDALSGIEAAFNAGIGKIVAIESMETRELYSKVPAVDEIIADFDDFDRNWLYTKLDKVS